MKWFKHDSDASNDPKIKKLKKRFGMVGYGVYFNLLEIIARKMEDRIEDFGFVPEDWDEDLLSIEFDIDTNTLRTMFSYMCEVGLFENKKGRLYNCKIQGRCDDYTARLLRNKPLPDESTNSVRTKSDFVPLEENRIEENRREEKEKSENKFSHSLEELSDSLPRTNVGSNKYVTLNRCLTDVDPEEYRVEERSIVKESKNKNFSPRSLEELSNSIPVTSIGNLPKAGRPPLEIKEEKRLQAKMSGMYDSTFGVKSVKTVRHFCQRYLEKYNRPYGSVVKVDTVAKNISTYFKEGETVESLKEMIDQYFESKKGNDLPIKLTTAFSDDTYRAWTQGKLGNNSIGMIS